MTQAKKKALGENPLFNSPKAPQETYSGESEFLDIVSADKLEEVKKTISTMKHEVKKLEQRRRNREDDYQRMTFIIRKDLLNKLRDYCYTERLSQKEGLEQALVAFLEDKSRLKAHPQRTRQVHKRK